MNRGELLKVAKPILFNTDMVRAILDGRKTVTRRVVKPQPTCEHGNTSELDFVYDELAQDIYCKICGYPADINKQIKAPYNKGDVLYVRETWNLVNVRPKRYLYKTYCAEAEGLPLRWHPSIHMPKEAARIFLRVTDVRVERLRDITPEEARAEGIYQITDGIDIGRWTYETNPEIGHVWSSPVECFLWGLWDSTVKKADHEEYDHRANPWVLVIKFGRIEPDDERRIV